MSREECIAQASIARSDYENGKISKEEFEHLIEMYQRAFESAKY